MEIKYILFLLPLVWAICIYVFTGNFGDMTGLTTNVVVSFIISAIAITSLSGFHVLDTGLSDGATWILFILIFGGMFYGVTVASTYFSGSQQVQILGLNGSPISLTLIEDGRTGLIYAQDFNNLDVNAIPSYIHYIKLNTSPISSFPVAINANFNESETTTTFKGSGFGTTANTGFGNPMFVDMPYFTMLNLVFAVMYSLGLYLMVATKG